MEMSLRLLLMNKLKKASAGQWYSFKILFFYFWMYDTFYLIFLVSRLPLFPIVIMHILLSLFYWMATILDVYRVTTVNYCNCVHIIILFYRVANILQIYRVTTISYFHYAHIIILSGWPLYHICRYRVTTISYCHYAHIIIFILQGGHQAICIQGYYY